MANPNKPDSDASPSLHLDQPSSAVPLLSHSHVTNTVPVEPYRDDPNADYSTDEYDMDDGDDVVSCQARSGHVISTKPRQPSSSDPPPLYSDNPTMAPPIDPLFPSFSRYLPDNAVVPPASQTDARTGNEVYISRLLDTDANHLKLMIQSLSLHPPRPHVRVCGTHCESSRKDKNRVVTDFDVRVDISPYLYRDVYRLDAWRTLRTVGNFDKVRRGTVWPTRAPGYGGSGGSGGGRGGSSGSGDSGLPVADEEGGAPDLAEWCERYVALPHRLKTMLIRRRVVGLDENLLRTRIVSMVRATRYHGSLDVTFPVMGQQFEIRSDVWENHWRLKPWLAFVFSITLLFVFAIPWFFFRTARFEVVNVDWAFSRDRDQEPYTDASTADESGDASQRDYVSISEEHWYNMWGRAIHKAVLDRRQGLLDQADLRAAQEAEGPTFADVSGGFVRASLSAMGVFDRQFGWGYDA